MPLKVNAIVSHVFDALECPEELNFDKDMDDIHAALKPHLINWAQDRGKRFRPIVMVSAVGSVNYGTQVSTSDLDLKAVYMPSFEDLYHNSFPKFSFTTDALDCELHPAHNFCDHMLKGNINFFEPLYAVDGSRIARPQFFYITQTIVLPMVEMNVVTTCMASYFTAINLYKKSRVVDFAVFDHKKASHSIRVLGFLINLLDTGKFDIKTKEPYLTPVLRLKNNTMGLVEYRDQFKALVSMTKTLMFKRWLDGSDYQHTDRVLELDGTHTARWHELRAELDNELMKFIREPIENRSNK